VRSPTARVRRGPRRREDEPGLRRVQIYLDERQDELLAGRAEAYRVTKSAIIREAIDDHLGQQNEETLRLRRLGSVIRAASGRAGYLAPGHQLVEEVRR
jgi:Ribbon-helix-helix protein, copG family